MNETWRDNFNFFVEIEIVWVKSCNGWEEIDLHKKLINEKLLFEPTQTLHIQIFTCYRNTNEMKNVWNEESWCTKPRHN